MCTTSRKMSIRSDGKLPKLACYIVLCLVICIHHSHQENNLSLDKIKGEEIGQYAKNMKENSSGSLAIKDQHDSDHDNDHENHDPTGRKKGRPARWHVWLASTGSISVIALCEVFAVLVVPIMQRVFYQHIIQFLIALAIGSLLGDATLHLIPHALLYDFHSHGDLSIGDKEHNHNQIDPHELHEKAVWLGLVVMISLMVFFSFERIINKMGEWRERRKREKTSQKKIQMASQRISVDQAGDRKPTNMEDAVVNEDEEKHFGAHYSVLHGASNPEAKKVKVIRSGHRPTCDMVVGERVCKHRYSSICVDDIDEIMNEAVTNCPKQNEECCLITANNNDNACRGGSFNNASPCSKKEPIVIEKVPEEELESQKKDISNTDMIPEDINDKFDNMSHEKNESDNIKSETGSTETHPKCVNVPEVNFAEKLMKAKKIFMNSSPSQLETPTETPLVGNINVDKDTQEAEDKYRGTMSTANSQTPFLLPTSNSCSTSPNGQAKLEKEKIQEPKPNIVGALAAPHDHSQHVAVIEGNISNKGDGEYKTVYVNEHEHFHHGHSHAHTHLHSAPDSISSVAWMVLLGDGIHSLADGLAIGAAFSESMTSGLSTALAVLCHELPHVVGDFAMLLRAGMSAKQAIVYKFLSSFVSFIGMVIGIFLGELEMVIPWILAATAGIFIYVALVDMMPELNSGHRHPISDHAQHDSHLKELCLQLIGMSLGTIIMLIIALHEDSIRALLSEPAYSNVKHL